VGQIPGRFGTTVKRRSKECQPEILLKENKKTDEKSENRTPATKYPEETS
jgi:hypothetical protein